MNKEVVVERCKALRLATERDTFNATFEALNGITSTLFHHLSSRYQVSLGEVPPFEQKGLSLRLRKGIR